MPARALQVFSNCRDRVRVRPGASGRARALSADGRGERAGEALQLARLDGEAVVGLRARVRRRGLDDVEPVHVGLAFEDAAAVYEVAGVAQVAGAGGEEIRVEREDAVGAVEAIDGVDGL